MQQLFPDRADLAVRSLYDGLVLPAGVDRPWVALGMVATLDGAATLNGQTADLGGEADAVAFRHLRAAADAILVGAGTVRAEDYGPAGGTAERRADRAARGLAERPRLVIVSGSLDLATDRRVFGDPESRPMIITHSAAPADRVAALGEVADVVVVGDGSVDLRAALAHLGSVGLHRVLCEGGPHLSGGLLTGDLIDELFLTYTPIVAGGDALRIAWSDDSEVAHGFGIVSLFEHDGELVVRYRRTR